MYYKDNITKAQIFRDKWYAMHDRQVHTDFQKGKH